MARLPAKAGKGALGWLAAQAIANEFMKLRTNRDEAYVDRIQREFRGLLDYAQARAIYDSDRAYWEKLYGSDPLSSRNHPASPPRSLLPRQPLARDPGYNYLDPAPMDSNAFGPFGAGKHTVPDLSASSQPLYETHSFVAPPDDVSKEETSNWADVRAWCVSRPQAWAKLRPTERCSSAQKILNHAQKCSSG